jgi:dihydroneopterin aldolase
MTRFFQTTMITEPDSLLIQGLQVYAHHGHLPEEHVLGQRFVLDVTLELNLRPAGASDALEDTLNYAEVCDTLAAWVKEKRFCLLEALAEHLARGLLQRYGVLQAVRLRVTKLHPPMPYVLQGVAAQVYRRAGD